jgi:hypothetical protein
MAKRRTGPDFRRRVLRTLRSISPGGVPGSISGDGWGILRSNSRHLGGIMLGLFRRVSRPESYRMANSLASTPQGRLPTFPPALLYADTPRLLSRGPVRLGTILGQYTRPSKTWGILPSSSVSACGGACLPRHGFLEVFEPASPSHLWPASPLSGV